MSVCRGHTAGYLLGKAGVPKHAIITALGGTPTPNMAAFIEALKVGTGSGAAACQGLHAAAAFSCSAGPMQHCVRV